MLSSVGNLCLITTLQNIHRLTQTTSNQSLVNTDISPPIRPFDSSPIRPQFSRRLVDLNQNGNSIRFLSKTVTIDAGQIIP